jgi:hypothetical protein
MKVDAPAERVKTSASRVRRPPAAAAVAPTQNEHGQAPAETPGRSVQYTALLSKVPDACAEKRTTPDRRHQVA